MQQHRVAHAAGDRADGVEAGRQRHGARGGCQRLGVLEADQAVQRRRDADRAAGVAAQRRHCRAGGHRDRAARARSAGNAGRRGRIERGHRHVGRRAVVRVDADAGEGELGHLRAADQRGAGRAQPGDGRSVHRGRRLVRQHDRSGARHLAGDVVEVLDADRQPGECAGACSRRRTRARLVNRDEGVCAARRAGRGQGLVEQRQGIGAAFVELLAQRVQVGGVQGLLYSRGLSGAASSRGVFPTRGAPGADPGVRDG